MILVVDDEISMREYLEVLLAQSGYEVQSVATVDEGKRRLQNGGIDLVISDMKLGNGSGMEILRQARNTDASPEVILITAFGTPAAAVEAMREGAYDYICKPFDNEELKLLVQKALEKRALKQENTALKRSLSSAGARLLIGESAAMRRVAQVVEKVAGSRSTVLITGESGTGKELVARSIHLSGPRSRAPFVPINCGAIAEGVLESELFGHVRGAFTGATQDREGILVSAGDGTVFLDEIGEIPPSLQVKLLRVLQERTVKPVGSTREQSFQARVLAATNRDLEKEVRTGRFREDLLYRLNVITIDVPPLRERADDIAILANHFLAKMREELGRPDLRFSREALDVIMRFPFPGNIRQLQNVVERAATLGESDLLGLETLPPALRGEDELPAGDLLLPPSFSLERHLDELERRHLLAALDRAGGVKMRAAELLGLSFRSFRYRLAKHGLTERDDAPPTRAG